MSEPIRLRARWIFPVDADPIENGVVEIEGGRIVALHDRAEPAAEALGNVALVPALVNAHTHLEFSDLRTPFEPCRPFTAWIRRLIRHRAARTVAVPEAVRQGLDESVRAGVGLVGEIATEGWSPAAFAGNRPTTIAFREVIALGPERFDEQVAIAHDHLADATAAGTGEGPGRGLSPHAPYSVHRDLFHALVDLAVEHRAPIAVHLAETLAELELLDRGTGELAEMLREFGVWSDSAFARGTRPLAYLEPLARLERGLVIHGNHLVPDECAFLAAHPQLSLVFCPRTHAYFGHRDHPWRELLAAGGNVAIGTDGRGSNPDLSVWSELRFLRDRFPGVAPRRLLELGTRNGAVALGRESEFGTLAVGRPANLTVIGLPDETTSDPEAAILHTGTRPIRTMLDGEWR